MLMTNEMHKFYNQILFHSFCLLYMFRKNLVGHHQEHSIIYCITQFGTIDTIYYAVLLMMNDWIHQKHVEQTKNCGIKIDYKNCASRWSLTHCNMMHGTHNVKLIASLHVLGPYRSSSGRSFMKEHIYNKCIHL